MDPAMIAAIEAAAAAERVEPLRMVSGAGHDAMVVARHARAGMLFVPSRDGISHAPAEWTAAEDCELGARVLARTLAALAATR
jgi:acetylornithine deacetylase/succinyl-diaminopimelate desuccinylase-like protein